MFELTRIHLHRLNRRGEVDNTASSAHGVGGKWELKTVLLITFQSKLLTLLKLRFTLDYLLGGKRTEHTSVHKLI